jgi:hypothetical protein
MKDSNRFLFFDARFLRLELHPSVTRGSTVSICLSGFVRSNGWGPKLGGEGECVRLGGEPNLVSLATILVLWGRFRLSRSRPTGDGVPDLPDLHQVTIQATAKRSRLNDSNLETLCPISARIYMSNVYIKVSHEIVNENVCAFLELTMGWESENAFPIFVVSRCSCLLIVRCGVPVLADHGFKRQQQRVAALR